MQRPQAIGEDKMKSTWLGPCKVLQRLCDHVYRVQVGLHRHQDVHVVNLKPHLPPLIGPAWHLFYHGEVKETDCGSDLCNVGHILHHRN